MMKAKTAILLLVVMVGFSVPLNAALIDRGTGMIYDTELGITWLQDANYAATSGYDGDGWMVWDDAMAWADQLEYGGITNWRLPNANPINGSTYDTGYANDGSKDRGYNISAPGTIYAGNKGSELAYLYYNSLGNVGDIAIDGTTPNPDFESVNTGPFVNVQSNYWTATEYPPNTSGEAFAFYMNQGGQGKDGKSYPQCAWAVHDGDYGPSVTETQTYQTEILLGTEISFAYWWDMGIDPPPYDGQAFDALALQADGSGWEWIGSTYAYTSSNGWSTASLVVPEAFQGIETQIRFVLNDFGPNTDPTVYLNNVASNSAPVPEPATIILLGTGLLGLVGLYRKKGIYRK